MNLARLTFLVSLSLLLVACGSSPAPKTINGAWKATLINSDSSPAYTFTAVLTQNTAPTVNVVSFLFSSAAPCFPTPLGQSATFSATGHSHGFQTGPFGMNVSTSFTTPMENILTMTGTRNSDGTISGTWTLTGLPGCTGSGTYTMQVLPSM